MHEMPRDEAGAVFGGQHLGQRSAVQFFGHDVEQGGRRLRCEADHQIGIDRHNQVGTVFGEHAKALPRLGVAALGFRIGHQHQATAVGQIHRYRARRFAMGIAPRGRTADQQVALGIGHVQRDAKPGQQLGKGFEFGVGHDQSSLRRTDAQHLGSRRMQAS